MLTEHTFYSLLRICLLENMLEDCIKRGKVLSFVDVLYVIGEARRIFENHQFLSSLKLFLPTYACRKQPVVNLFISFFTKSKIIGCFLYSARLISKIIRYFFESTFYVTWKSMVSACVSSIALWYLTLRLLT